MERTHLNRNPSKLPNEVFSARLRATLIRCYPDLRVLDVDYLVCLYEHGVIDLDMLNKEARYYCSVPPDHSSLTCYQLFPLVEHIERKSKEDLFSNKDFE